MIAVSPEGRYPFGKKARAELTERIAGEAEVFSLTGAKEVADGVRYTWIDSPLDTPTRDGEVSFLSTFRRVLPENTKSMREYIERTLAEKRGRAVGIEFGGIGSRLFRDFSPGFFEQSLAITLVDHRHAMKEDLYSQLNFEVDKRIHHSVYEGDIFSPETDAYIDTWLAGKSVDFIIERMAKGLEFVPEDPYVLTRKIQEWWHLLGEGGVLFVQVPFAMNPVFKPWVSMLKNQYGNSVDIEYAIGWGDKTTDGSVLHLRKLANSPTDLPTLDPRTVREISKKSDAKGVY